MSKHDCFHVSQYFDTASIDMWRHFDAGMCVAAKVLTLNGPVSQSIRPRTTPGLLIVYGERPVRERTKAGKDLLQAASLIEFFFIEAQ